MKTLALLAAALIAAHASADPLRVNCVKNNFLVVDDDALRFEDQQGKELYRIPWASILAVDLTGGYPYYEFYVVSRDLPQPTHCIFGRRERDEIPALLQQIALKRDAAKR